MDGTFNMEKAQEVLERSSQEAQELLRDPSKLEGMLRELPEKLQAIPGVGGILKDIPLTIALVKSCVTGEYRDISLQNILPLVGAFAYLFKKKDLIRDNIPLLGYADDLAVLGLAMKALEPDLRAFEAWRNGGMASASQEADAGAEAEAGAEAAAEAEDTGEPLEYKPEKEADEAPAEEAETVMRCTDGFLPKEKTGLRPDAAAGAGPDR